MKDITIKILKPEGQSSLYADVVRSDFAQDQPLTTITLPDDQQSWIRAGQETLSGEALATIGNNLFTSIFTGRIRDIYQQTKGSLQDGESLRLRFVTEHNTFHNVPLELLCASITPNPEFFAWNRERSIVRGLIGYSKESSQLGITRSIRMLVVIAAYELSGIDAEEERLNLEKSILRLVEDGDIVIDYLGTSGKPPASKEELDRMLEDAYRNDKPYHILHFIGHGGITDTPQHGALEGALEFVGDDHTKHLVYASQLAQNVADFGVQFVALQSCAGAKTTRQNTFQGVAQYLIYEGVPAVLAMQWPVEQDVARIFFQRFYECWLTQGDEIDKSVVEGRIKVFGQFSDRGQVWANPALFLRNDVVSLQVPPLAKKRKTGNGREALFIDWKSLVDTVFGGECMVILGPDAGALPPGRKIEVARYIRDDEDYPYLPEVDTVSDETVDRCEGYLARVAQYIWVKDNPDKPKKDMIDWLLAHKKDARCISALQQLAGLPIPIFATTNYDDLMATALRQANKLPKEILCGWNRKLFNNLDPQTRSKHFELESDYVPQPDEPLIFYFYGLARDKKLASWLVLAEDDYLNFLINVSQNDYDKPMRKTLLPTQIRNALNAKHLLFLGYRYNDLSFRILLKSIKDVLQGNEHRTFVSIQLVPPPPQNARKVFDYLAEYLETPVGLTKVQVFWGEFDRFVSSLKTESERMGYAV